MKRLILSVTAMCLLAAACQGKSGSLGSLPSPSKSPSPSATSPSPTLSPSPGATPVQSNRKVTFQVWLSQNDKLFVTKRTRLFAPGVAQLALNALLDGPSGPEAQAGIETAMLGVDNADITALANGLATVQVNDAFFQETGARLRMRRAQLVFTLTQYATIRRVRFAGSDGKPVAGTWGRGSFGSLLPAILVESPLIGSKVSSPVTVSGTANVFEATVSLRILDENGDEIARTFTTATCGTGCRGDYSVSVPFTVDHQQRGTIEVFESSARDGSPINLVSIPVILIP